MNSSFSRRRFGLITASHAAAPKKKRNRNRKRGPKRDPEDHDDVTAKVRLCSDWLASCSHSRPTTQPPAVAANRAGATAGSPPVHVGTVRAEPAASAGAPSTGAAQPRAAAASAVAPRTAPPATNQDAAQAAYRAQVFTEEKFADVAGLSKQSLTAIVQLGFSTMTRIQVRRAVGVLAC
jgi:hypothetical protein